MSDTLAGLLDLENLRAVARRCAQDDDGSLSMMLRARFEESGLLAVLGLTANRPVAEGIVSEFPSNFTAYQEAIFDNGPQFDRRGRERSAKTQFVVDLKLWTSPQPNFREKPDYQMRSSLWTVKFARNHLTKLRRKGSLTAEFTDDCDKLLSALEGNWWFGIPKRRLERAGSQYLDGHFFALQMTADAPHRLIACHLERVIDITEFSTVDPVGNALIGNVIAAARIAVDVELPHWQTEKRST